MPPLDFPPGTPGATYTGPGGIVWAWDGAKWGNGVSAASAATPSDTAPAMDGTAAAGASALYSRGDHVHPTDTSRYAAANPSGYQTAAQVTAVVPGTNFADNAGFAVNQRAYVSGAALGAGVFGHDRWKGGASGGTYTFTASPPSTAITITAGTLQQVIEGAGIVGGNYVLSWTGTAQGRIGAASYAASPVTVAGITAGANTTIEFNTGTLSRVKFESGSVATPWQALPQQQDLAKCQRFYQVAVVSWHGTGTAGQNIGYTVPYPVPMRGTAAVTPFSTSFTNASTFTTTPYSHSIQAAAVATATGYATFFSGLNLSAEL